MTLRQSAFTRKLLNDYGMADCNPRSTPLEASVLGKMRKELAKGKLDGPLGKEKELSKFQGKIMWLFKTRPP